MEDGKTGGIRYSFSSLQKSTQHWFLSGGVSDEAGRFMLEKIPYGEYVLHVKMLGFITKKIAR
jgi:hypothetical protein